MITWKPPYEPHEPYGAGEPYEACELPYTAYVPDDYEEAQNLAMSDERGILQRLYEDDDDFESEECPDD